MLRRQLLSISDWSFSYIDLSPLHYLQKLKNSNFLQMWKKCKQIAFLITSNFVLHPQILIFLGFKISSRSSYWLQIKFSLSLFFYILTYTINLLHQKFVTADVTAVSVNIVFGDEDKILIKSLHLKGYTAKSAG